MSFALGTIALPLPPTLSKDTFIGQVGPLYR